MELSSAAASPDCVALGAFGLQWSASILWSVLLVQALPEWRQRAYANSLALLVASAAADLVPLPPALPQGAATATTTAYAS